MRNKKHVFIYFCLFTGIGFVFTQIPFTNIIGSNQTFSLFDFFAPAIGAFIASIWGAVTVICVKIIATLANGQAFDTATVIRLFPLALAALYFGARRYQKLVALIPLACIALFIMHPEGRQSWFYSLYWLIPMASAFVSRSLILKSLGATFTAHALGSVAFLYAFNLPAATWIELIPVVFLERMLFAGGTALSYVFLNSLLSYAGRLLSIQALQRIVRQEYTFSKKF